MFLLTDETIHSATIKATFTPDERQYFVGRMRFYLRSSVVPCASSFFFFVSLIKWRRRQLFCITLENSLSLRCSNCNSHGQLHEQEKKQSGQTVTFSWMICRNQPRILFALFVTSCRSRLFFARFAVSLAVQTHFELVQLDLFNL